MHHVFLLAVTALSLTALSVAAAQTRAVVLDNVRIIDGTGAAPIEQGRIVIDGDRVARKRGMQKRRGGT